MNDKEVSSDVVKVDDLVAAIKLKDEDIASLKDIQAAVSALNRYRQELGRLFQVIHNVREEADRTEIVLRDKRNELAKRYNLEPGQWALDFENKEFVKTAPDAPVIP